jgi:hypothetical protein
MVLCPSMQVTQIAVHQLRPDLGLLASADTETHTQGETETDGQLGRDPADAGVATGAGAGPGSGPRSGGVPPPALSTSARALSIIAALAVECWAHDAERRPTFAKVRTRRAGRV